MSYLIRWLLRVLCISTCFVTILAQSTGVNPSVETVWNEHTVTRWGKTGHLVDVSRSANWRDVELERAGMPCNRSYGPRIKSPVEDLPHQDTQQEEPSEKREDL